MLLEIPRYGCLQVPDCLQAHGALQIVTDLTVFLVVLFVCHLQIHLALFSKRQSFLISYALHSLE